MNAKLEVLYMEFPTGVGPYVILRRWSLVEESLVSDVIVEWGEVSSDDIPVERHFLLLDAYLPDDELIAIAKTKLPDTRKFKKGRPICPYGTTVLQYQALLKVVRFFWEGENCAVNWFNGLLHPCANWEHEIPCRLAMPYSKRMLVVIRTNTVWSFGETLKHSKSKARLELTDNPSPRGGLINIAPHRAGSSTEPNGVDARSYRFKSCPVPWPIIAAHRSFTLLHPPLGPSN